MRGDALGRLEGRLQATPPYTLQSDGLEMQRFPHCQSRPNQTRGPGIAFGGIVSTPESNRES
jgi:hypothetical protein